MNLKLNITLLLTGILAAVGIAGTLPKVEAKLPVQFVCGQRLERRTNQSYPTTWAVTARGKTAIVQWERAFGGYSPQERCESVSPRFQQAYDNGSLNILTNGTENGKRVICTAKEYGERCVTVLMTLRQEDNSLKMLEELKDTLNGRSLGPIQHGGGVPQAYYEINIDEWLDNAPVEKEQP